MIEKGAIAAITSVLLANLRSGSHISRLEVEGSALLIVLVDGDSKLKQAAIACGAKPHWFVGHSGCNIL